MPKRAVVHLNIIDRHESCDIDVPLDIDAAELLEGLNHAFDLGVSTDNASQVYVKTENPVALMHGRRTLEQYGIMAGSVINVSGGE